jgi:hypothetical protein
MRAVERLRNRLTQRAAFGIIHNHCCPRNGLQRYPLQTDCATECANRDGASKATKHAHETSERLSMRQSTLAESRKHQWRLQIPSCAIVQQLTMIIVSNKNFPLRTALRLEIITIIWMVIEAIVAIGAGLAARSLMLFAFGLDSAIELTSAIVVFRRFRFELNQESERDLRKARDVERKTARIAGYLLMLLSAYIVVQAIFGLMTRHAAETSAIGIAVAVVAAVGMPVLARAKLRVVGKIDSRSLRADAMETLTCGYLSWVLLAGLILNALTKWWWTDSVASLGIVPLLVREAREALSGGSCSGCDPAK